MADGNINPIDADCAQFLVDSEGVGRRLDVVLAGRFQDVSRGMLQNAIQAGAVTVNGKKVKPSLKLENGDAVVVDVEWFLPKAVEPQAAEFDVLHEDEHILVIVKPAGLTVHPSAGCPDHTLVNALYARNPEIFAALDDGSHRPGIVHRLDRDTSGVMVIAKTLEAQDSLKEQFREHATRKIYFAILDGHLPSESGTLETLMGKHPKYWDRRAVLPEGTANGKTAVTKFKTVAENETRTLVKVSILTGRTHQIRVHMAYLGAPVAGDRIYGGKVPPGRQMLHAALLKFRHPASEQTMTFSAAPPRDFINELAGLASPELLTP